MSLADFINSRPKLKNSKEIVFFGGSFNPWHEGHKSCVELLPPEKSLVIAPDHNPYKELVADKSNPIARIEEALSDSSREAFVFDEFLKANKKNPTYFWLKDLNKEIPGKSYSLLMGFDTFIGIDKWIEAPSLLKLLDHIYIASRLDDPKAKEEQIRLLKKLAPDLNIHFLGGHPHESLSSTALRKSAK